MGENSWDGTDSQRPGRSLPHGRSVRAAEEAETSAPGAVEGSGAMK